MIVKLRLKYMEAFVNQIRPGSDMLNERTGSVSCRHTNLVKCLGKVNCIKLTWLSCGESPCHKRHMRAGDVNAATEPETRIMSKFIFLSRAWLRGRSVTLLENCSTWLSESVDKLTFSLLMSCIYSIQYMELLVKPDILTSCIYMNEIF
jgi:hypothetical protein